MHSLKMETPGVLIEINFDEPGQLASALTAIGNLVADRGLEAALLAVAEEMRKASKRNQGIMVFDAKRS